MKGPMDMLPTWALALLERLVPWHIQSDVVGDLAEMYAWMAREEGRWTANKWFAGQVLKALPVFVANGLNLGGSMFQTYIIVAWRNLAKRKFYAFLNVGGLAIGMAICLLIIQFVTFETSFDRYHDRIEDLYRINLKLYTGDALTSHDPFTSYAVASTIASSVPAAERVSRYHPVYGTATLLVDTGQLETFRTSKFAYVDPAHFELFTYPDIHGSARQALLNPDQVVVTSNAAKRLFGTADAVGMSLRVYAWLEQEYTVGAVVEDHKGNSHLAEEIWAPLQPLIDDPDSQYAEDSGWDWTNFVTYVQLRPGSDPAAVARAMDAAILSANREEFESLANRLETDLQSVERIHLHSTFSGGSLVSGAARNVLFVSIIGLFVLVIAWLNFINLTTSRAMERSIEVGIRKATGARRGQVAMQFLSESVFINFIALVMSVGLAIWGLPWLNELANTQVSQAIWFEPRLWAYLLLVFGLGSVLASTYPSFVLSRFAPMAILRGIGSQSRSRGRARQGMVVFQFILSISLLSGTWIVYKQLAHMRGVDPGFDLEQVIAIESPSVIDDSEAYRSNRSSFREKVRTHASVVSASSSSMIPGTGYNLSTEGRPESSAPSDAFPVRAFWIGADFFQTYSMQILAGREMDPESGFDRENAVVLNETAMHAFDLKSPEEAIGSRIILGAETTLEVVGVARDFQWMTAKAAIEPTIMLSSRGGSWYSVKLVSSSIPTMLPWLEEQYEASFPGNSFQYVFADDRFDEQFRSEERLADLVSVFSLFAVLVAALGLVGLAALTASQRNKEMSIRKVLGAGPLDIVRMVVAPFAMMVGVASLLSTPAVWWIAELWLDNFESRMEINAVLFIGPALLVLVVSIVASSWHIGQLSRANPVEGIRAT